MKTDNNFVRSGRERIEDDNYQTVDPRCVQALLETLTRFQGFADDDSFVDCCAPSGSGIVTELCKRGLDAVGVDDAFGDFSANWIVSNPPYKRNVVDSIIFRQLERLSVPNVIGVAMLLRTQFDHAKTRYNMFAGHPFYAGQIKMTFRPIWFAEGESTPIHNYVWQIWVKDWNRPPIVQYW